MYVKPEVTRYTGSELLDLMGPVETAYVDCELRVPQPVTCDQNMTYGVVFSEIPDFEEALFNWQRPNGSLHRDTFDRSEGTEVDTTWRIDLTIPCDEPLGAGWSLSVILINDDTATCSEDFSLID